MRAIIRFTFLAAVATVAGRFALGGNAPSPKDRSAIESAVLACHDQTLAAAEALDLDRLFSFVAETDQGSLIKNGTLYLTRDDTIATTRQGFQRIRSIRYAICERHVTILSSASALLVTTGRTNATTEDGQMLSVPYAQTIVFVLQNGAWRVVHMHSSSPTER
jgi:hypothetical protein